MTLFKQAVSRMDRIITARLSDGKGDFEAASGHRCHGLDLIIDSSFEMGGVKEILTGNIKAITVRKCQMAGATPVRGDVFRAYTGRRYIVEDTLSDDQHFPVYACMEQRP